MLEPVVQNSLLRCIRNDGFAHAPFKDIPEVPGLKVFELGPNEEAMPWSRWIEQTSEALAANQEVLAELKGSEGFTLHVDVLFNGEPEFIALPVHFSLLLGTLGIQLDVALFESEKERPTKT